MKQFQKFLLRLLVAVSIVGGMTLAPQHVAYGAPQTRLTTMLDMTAEKEVPLPFPATHIVVRWDGDAGATVQVRGLGEDGVWQPWQTATIDEDGGATQESGLLIFDNVTKMQGRVVAGLAEGLRGTAIDAENGPRTVHLVSNTKEAGAVGGYSAQPPIISRAGWGADESLRRGTPEFAPIARMDVHHTVTSNNDPDPAATVRAIYSWHTQGNGWNDIGYNFLIDQQGRIYEGRYARAYAAGEMPTAEDTAGNGVVGAHTLNHNTGTVGIALLGTFNSVAPSAPQQQALVKLMAWEADRHGIDPTAAGSILGHRDLYQTECPGDSAYALLPQWRQQTAALTTLAVPPGTTPGYWIAGANGSVSTYGAAADYGSMAGKGLNASVIGMTSTPTAKGYWLLGSDGGIFSFGNATFWGSTGSMRLNKPIVGMASTPSGNGYWLVASDGGIFAFGDARFWGSTGSMRLNKPVVGMAATKSGNGYWLVASDGGIFAFGDAAFYGSTGNLKLASPVVTIKPTPSGTGYWMMAGDGGVFAFNAPFLGSIPMLNLSSFSGTKTAATTSSGKGYYMLSNDGGLYTFGDARFHGSASGKGTAADIAVLPG